MKLVREVLNYKELCAVWELQWPWDSDHWHRKCHDKTRAENAHKIKELLKSRLSEPSQEPDA